MSLLFGQILENVTVFFLKQLKAHGQMMVLQDRRIVVHQGKFRILKERREIRRLAKPFILSLSYSSYAEITFGLELNFPYASLLALVYITTPRRQCTIVTVTVARAMRSWE